MKNNGNNNDLSSLRNIGPTIQKRLHEIGINSKKRLEGCRTSIGISKDSEYESRQNNSSMLLSVFPTGST